MNDDAKKKQEDMHRLPDYLELAAAAKASDERVEVRNSLPEYAETDLEIDFESLHTMAEQRAMRAALIATGDEEKLAPLREGLLVQVRLTEEQHRLFAVAVIAVMDGFSIGALFARGQVGQYFPTEKP